MQYFNHYTNFAENLATTCPDSESRRSLQTRRRDDKSRVGLFLEEYKKIGAALNKAQDAYNAAEAKLDTKGQSIIYTSNKLIKLGARNSEKHPVPEFIDIDLISE